MMEEHHEFTEAHDFIFPLSDADLELLKAGASLPKIYHPLWTQAGVLVVLVGKKNPRPEDPAIKKWLRQGWEFVNYPVDDKILAEVRQGDSVPVASYGPVRSFIYGGMFTVSLVHASKVKDLVSA
jgi:hypothetical protein